MSDQIDVNELSNAIQEKMDLDMGNMPQNIDFVVESQNPTASEPRWYRLYKSGWIEQGGYIANNSTTTTVLFLKNMADTNYCITGGLLNGTASTSYEHMNFNTLTTSGFKFTSYDSYGVKWEVKGMSATS